MQENSLYKAIYYNLGSLKDRAKKLGIQREPIYAWIKGVGKIPLAYVLQIDYLTGGEVHWKALVPFPIVQRLKYLTRVLSKFALPPCELVTEMVKKEDISCKLMQHSAQVYIKKYEKLRQLVENRLVFGSHFTYLSAKKLKRIICEF